MEVSVLEVCSGGQAELLVHGELSVAPTPASPPPPSPPSPPPPLPPPPSPPPPPSQPVGSSWIGLQPWGGGACPVGTTSAVVSVEEAVQTPVLEMCSGGQAELLVL
eukprot:3667443-Prymnesium_polylepis.1